MKRRAFVGGLIMGLPLASPALASDVVESIIRQLKKQGFVQIEQERTLLGRVRVVATRKDGAREIIINPRTGEILRDLWTPLDGGKGAVQIINEPSNHGGGGDHGGGKSGSGGSGGGSHDDDDDDDDDDDHGGGGGKD